VTWHVERNGIFAGVELSFLYGFRWKRVVKFQSLASGSVLGCVGIIEGCCNLAIDTEVMVTTNIGHHCQWQVVDCAHALSYVQVVCGCDMYHHCDKVSMQARCVESQESSCTVEH